MENISMDQAVLLLHAMELQPGVSLEFLNQNVLPKIRMNLSANMSQKDFNECVETFTEVCHKQLGVNVNMNALLSKAQQNVQTAMLDGWQIIPCTRRFAKNQPNYPANLLRMQSQAPLYICCKGNPKLLQFNKSLMIQRTDNVALPVAQKFQEDIQQMFRNPQTGKQQAIPTTVLNLAMDKPNETLNTALQMKSIFISPFVAEHQDDEFRRLSAYIADNNGIVISTSLKEPSSTKSALTREANMYASKVAAGLSKGIVMTDYGYEYDENGKLRDNAIFLQYAATLQKPILINNLNPHIRLKPMSRNCMVANQGQIQNPDRDRFRNLMIQNPEITHAANVQRLAQGLKNDFVLAKFVGFYNDHFDYNDQINRISAKMARHWRSEIDRRWTEENPGPPWRHADTETAMTFAKSVLTDLFESHPLPVRELPETEEKIAMRKEAGFAYDISEAIQNFESLREKQILPVTGIDPIFEDREIAATLGCKIGYLKEREMMEKGIYRLHTYDGCMTVNRIRKKGAKSEYYDQIGSLSVFKTDQLNSIYGPLLTQTDLYGLNGISRRLDPEISRGNPVLKFAQKLPNVLQMAPSEVDIRLREIRHLAGLGESMLNWMDSTGLMYSVSLNDAMGSLSADVAGTKTSVDILRLPDKNPECIGTIRGDGIERRISVNFGNGDKDQKYLPTKGQLILNLAYEFFPSGFDALRRKASSLEEIQAFPVPGKFNLDFSDPNSRSDSYYTKDSHVTKFGFAFYPNFNQNRPIENSGLEAQQARVTRPGTAEPYAAAMYTTFQRGSIQNFVTPYAGADFVEKCVKEAKENFNAKVNLDGSDGFLAGLSTAEQYVSENPDLTKEEIEQIYEVCRPEWSSDEICADTQKAIWNYLKNGNEDAYISVSNNSVSADPEHTIIETEPVKVKPKDFETIQDFMDEVKKAYFGDFKLSDLNPQREHDVSYIPEFTGSFDITRVVSFMSSTSERQNRSDLINALQTWNPENVSEIIECHEYSAQQAADSLITFDEASAMDLRNHTKPANNIEKFKANVGSMIKDALLKSSISQGQDDKIEIDKNGVIRFTGLVHTSEKNFKPSWKTTEPNVWKGNQLRLGIPVEGIIGQIFIPEEIDDCGGVMLTTAFAKSKNQIRYLNKTLTVAPKTDPFDRFNLGDRIYATTYMTMIEQAIYKTVPKIALEARSRLEKAVGNVSMMPPDKRLLQPQKIGSPTVLNEQLYIGNRIPCVRQPLNQHEIDEKNQTSEEHIKCRHEINLRQATFNSLLHATDFFQLVKFQQNGRDMTNDTVRSYLDELDWKAINVMGRNRDKIIDTNFTANNDKQGVKVMLNNNAMINSLTGHISVNPNTPLVAPYEALMPYNKFDAGNRVTMSLVNLQNALKVTTSKVAYTCALGYNLEDAIVVSKEFAEKNPVMNHDGELRPLRIDDKLSDTHGNKGVISLVVDRNMSMKAAEKRGIGKIVQLYKDNPELDLVMSPFPALSRSNGGLGAEGIANHQDLIIDGKVHEGGMIEVVTIITDKLGEDKTTTYEGTDGRKFSEEIGTALATRGKGKIIRSAFQSNPQALRNLREYLILTGMDISPLTKLQIGYHPHPGEERYISPRISPFKTGEDGALLLKKNTGEYAADTKECARIFNERFAESGGFIEIDFELHYPYPNHNPIPPIVVNEDGTKHPASTDEEWRKFGYEKNAQRIWERSIETAKSNAKNQNLPDYIRFPTYALPVLEPALRKERTEDGVLHHSDLSAKYIKIIEKNTTFRARLESRRPGDRTKTYITDLGKYQKEAQAIFNGITGPVTEKILGGRKNFFKKSLMMNTFENSSTAVMHSNSRLKCNELEVSPSVFKSMNLKEGEENWIIIFRNPVLTNGGIRYVKVKQKPDIEGAGMAPHTCKSFEGDFDGDTFGLVNITDPKAREEAEDTLVWANNLLNVNDVEDMVDPDEPGAEIHPIWMHTISDIAVAMHYHPELKQEWTNLTLDANRVWRQYQKTKDHKKYLEANEGIINSLDEFYAKAYDLSFGMATVSYASPEAHFTSILEGSVKTGAKGDPKKLAEYAEQMGYRIEYNYDTNGNVTGIKEVKDVVTDTYTAEVQETSFRISKEGISQASAMKSKGTGVAGKFKLDEFAYNKGRWVAAGTTAENLDISISIAGLGTQRLLQAKKDPDAAMRIFEILHDPCYMLLNEGKPIKYREPEYNEFGAMTYPGGWQQREVDEKTEDVLEIWFESAYQFITSPNGLNRSFSKEQLHTYAENMMTYEVTGPDGEGRQHMVGLRDSDYLKQNGDLLNELVANAKFETIVEAAVNERMLIATKESADFFPKFEEVQAFTQEVHNLKKDNSGITLTAAANEAEQKMLNSSMKPSPVWENKKVLGTYGKTRSDIKKEQAANPYISKLDEIQKARIDQPQTEAAENSGPEFQYEEAPALNSFDLEDYYGEYIEEETFYEASYEEMSDQYDLAL